MPLARMTLGRLAVPINRSDYPAFIEAVERLPGRRPQHPGGPRSGELLRTFEHGRYLRQNTALSMLAWLAQFQQANVEEA